MQDHFLLQLHLSAMVPLAIAELKRRGGPDEWDYERIRGYVTDLASKSDTMLYPSKQRGQAADIMNKLVEALAVLAFFPGGITAFGLHFNASGIPAGPDDGRTSSTDLASTLADCLDRLPPGNPSTTSGKETRDDR